jgi:protein-S-isoprenylcysteine O-methyltransferase Ste14
VAASSRIPSLGQRGEGWVALQFICLAAIALLGMRDLPGALAEGASRTPELVIGLTVMAIGGLVILLGVVELRANLSVLPRPRQGSALVESGIYARIRHPMYAGLVEMSLGWAAVTSSGTVFVACLVLAVVLDLKARREEAWLTENFAAYSAYRRRTRRFIPYLY